jgi:hypothetical protein
VFFEGHAAFDQAGAFALEQAALQAGKRFADRDSTARGDNTVPGNGLTARGGSHGSPGGPSAAREPRGAGQLAVGEDAPLGDALD